MSGRAPLLKWSKEEWSNWSDRPRLSLVPVPRTCFLQLKAPLSTLYEEKFGSTSGGGLAVFTVPMYMSRCASKGIRVGLVIDCTAYDSSALGSSTMDSPSRFYFHDPAEWDQFDCEYKVLPPQDASAPGVVPAARNFVIPSPETVRSFISMSNAHFFSAKNSHVAVFDTAFTAGPFLIASFLVEVLRAPVDVAIQSAGIQQPPGAPLSLYSRALVAELQKRYGGKGPIKLPARPTWAPKAMGEDEDQETPVLPVTADAMPPPPMMRPAATTSSSSSSFSSFAAPQNSSKRHKTGASSSTPLEEVSPNSGVFVRVMTVLHELCSACHKSSTSAAPPSSSSSSSDNMMPPPPPPSSSPSSLDATSPFPGVSSRRCLTSALPPSQQLTSRHVVSWLPVGRRGLLLVLRDGVFFIEKTEKGTMQVSRAPKMHFPSPAAASKLSASSSSSSSSSSSASSITTQHRTLLDGVLVEDIDKGELTLRYLIFDVLVHEGSIVASKKYSLRLQYASDGVLKPRKVDPDQSKYTDETFRVRVKDVYELDRAKSLVGDDFKAKLTHETAGLVFTSKDEPYAVQGGFGRDRESGIVTWREGSGSENSLAAEEIIEFLKKVNE